MDELKELGLSDNEISVYISLLKLGYTSANKIAQISGLKRSTTYDNLQLLMSKGIVSSSVRDKVHFYQAAKPKKLVHILEDKVKKVKSIVTDLENLSKDSISQGGVTYFEGKKGVLTVLNDVLDNTDKKFYYIGSRKMAKIPLKHYPDNFLRRRIDAKIFVEGKLAEEDKMDSFIQDSKAESISQFTYEKKLNKSKAIMFIYSNKIAFITNREDPVGIIIDNKDISNFLQTLILN